jgi:hypothetical protein
MSNLDKFMTEYEKQLKIVVLKYPEEYPWPVENVPIVAGKMRAAFIAKTYNKDGRAIKATCKILDIKYTYTAINEYLAS